MAKPSPSKGIFHGTDEIVSEFFGLAPRKTLKQKSTYLGLTPNANGPSDFVALIAELYRKIERNRTDRPPSKENWRSQSQINSLDPKNRSPEVLLERAIAILGRRGILEGWFNQVPVASGLVDSSADGRAAIDLVCHQNDKAELVELKCESDTPAYAALEILRYGLAYLFCYVNREVLEYTNKPLMNVKEVSLRVLAPQPYYAGSDLTWLGEGFDHGIRALAAQKSDGALSMDFGYLAFPSEFVPPFSDGADVLSMMNLSEDSEMCQILISAMRNIEPIWRGSESGTP